VTGPLRALIATIAAVTGASLVALALALFATDLSLPEVRTVMFGALSVGALAFVFSVKHLGAPVWRGALFSNRYLAIAFGASCLLLIAALALPPVRAALSLAALAPGYYAVMAGVGIFNLAVIEALKFFVLNRKRGR
jgi:hypothetical protein